VSRLLRKKRENDELQVGGIEFPAGAETAAEHATLETPHEFSPSRPALIVMFAVSQDILLGSVKATTEHATMETSHNFYPLCWYEQYRS
jgi:hypothetical protein